MWFVLLLVLLLVAIVVLWPVPVMPKRMGAWVLAIRLWLRHYWDSQGG